MEERIEDDAEIVRIFGRLPSKTFPALHRGYRRIRDAFKDFWERKTKGRLVPKDNNADRSPKEVEFNTPQDLLVHHLGNTLLPMKFALESGNMALRHYLSSEEIKKIVQWLERIDAFRNKL